MADGRKLEIDDLLSSLQKEGKVVSQGGDFTLNIKKAKGKLKEYQLSNPNFYILKLVQSAVLAGASEIEVQCQAHRVSFEHDGLPPTPDELNELLNYLFLSDEESDPAMRALKRLASAVNTAVAAQARTLTVECLRDGESYSQKWTAEDTEFKTAPSEKTKPLTRFVLNRKGEDVASSLRHVGDTRLIDLVQGNRNAIQKEEAALWDRCIFCPIPLVVNGERVDRTAFGTPRYPGYDGKKSGRVPLVKWLSHRDEFANLYCHHRFHLIQAYYPQTESPVVSLTAPAEAHTYLESRDHPHRAGQSCSLILGLESGLRLPNRLNFIREGVLVEQERLSSKVEGLVALVNADGLGTDLSGFSMTRNQKYAKCRQNLNKALIHLLNELKEREGELPYRVYSLIS